MSPSSILIWLKFIYFESGIEFYPANLTNQVELTCVTCKFQNIDKYIFVMEALGSVGICITDSSYTYIRIVHT